MEQETETGKEMSWTAVPQMVQAIIAVSNMVSYCTRQTLGFRTYLRLEQNTMTATGRKQKYVQQLWTHTTQSQTELPTSQGLWGWLSLLAPGGRRSEESSSVKVRSF